MWLQEQPWLRGYVVQGDVLFPACGYLCMAVEACRQLYIVALSTFLPQGSTYVSKYLLREISISRALVISKSAEGVETMFSMQCPSSSGSVSLEIWHEFGVFSYIDVGGWAENCRGLVSVSA